MLKNIFVLFLILILSLISGCDKGIEPEPETTFPPGQMGFSGKVTFTGGWPAGIKRTHIVIFKNQIQTSDDFFPPNLAFVIDSISYRSIQFTYNSVNNNFIPIFQIAPGDYQYIVVAQSRTQDISLERKDWFIVGIYYKNNDRSRPGTMTIQDGRMTTGIDVYVDFNNPPPQPPGG